MSFEVFEVEKDWSSACISVRKRCVFDIISITYARFIYWLEIMLEVSSGLLDIVWKPLGDVLTTFCNRLDPFWALLEGFAVFWRVLEASWHRLGACEELLENLGASCGAS